MKKERADRLRILKFFLFILAILSLVLISSELVSAKNVFFTTQELNRTPPDMGVSGYGAADISLGGINEN